MALLLRKIAKVEGIVGNNALDTRNRIYHIETNWSNPMELGVGISSYMGHTNYLHLIGIAEEILERYTMNKIKNTKKG